MAQNIYKNGVLSEANTIAGRETKIIQTHTAVSIPATTTSNGTWQPCEGFDKIYASVNMTAGTGMSIWIDWSFDGTTLASGSPLTNPTGATSTGEYLVAAPYFRLNVKNNDSTNPKTTSAWAYLKA